MNYHYDEVRLKCTTRLITSTHFMSARLLRNKVVCIFFTAVHSNRVPVEGEIIGACDVLIII